MRKSDGSVIIDTKIDTSGIDRGMSATKGKINSLSSAVSKLGNSIKSAFTENFAGGSSNKGVENYEAQIKKLETQLDRLIEKQIRFVETGGNKKSRAFAGMEYDIEMVSNKLEELRAKQAQVSQSANTQPARTQFTALRDAIARVGKAAGSAVLNVVKLAGKGIANGVVKLGASIKKMASSMLSLRKNTKGAHGSMLKMLGSSILFSAVFRAISGLLNGFKEGMNNLVQYSGEANTAMSALKSSLTQLKNSFATAFAPLISSVMPILTAFIDSISKAASTVGAFFSALTGKSTYTQAVKVQEDYAASLDGTAKSTDKATKAQNKYLSGLDEIRTFTEPAAGGESQVSPSDMFEEVEIANPIATFAEKVKSIFGTIKELFANEDWGGLGDYLSEGINSALNKLYETLNWENIKAKILPVVTGFTETFNSLADGFDWNRLGETIGTGINTVIYTLGELITGIDWANFGTKLGEGLNGFVQELDWESLATTLSDGIKGLLDLAINFIETTDWKELGNKLADFLANIDWAGISDRLFEGLGAALGGLTALLWGLIEDAWNSVVEWWHDVAFEDGKFTITGLLDGIWEVAKDIGNWLMEHVVDPFINGFKEAFGIHSPSTVMAEFGEYIVKGLKNGIDGLVGILKEPINKIITSINSLIEKVTQGINSIIDSLNALSFDVPDWVPAIGGETFGFDIPSITPPKIPMLASGAVIPPNAPFMAMLGDQRHGTNIEAPLSTIESALDNVLNRRGGASGSMTLHNVMQVNRRVLYDEFIEEAKLRQATTGRNPFDLA